MSVTATKTFSSRLLTVNVCKTSYLIYLARANQAKENRELNFEEEDQGSVKQNVQDSVDYDDFGLGSNGGGGTTGKV
jgi:hypothetical protein